MASSTRTTSSSVITSINDDVAQVEAIEACLKSSGWSIVKCGNCGTAKATVQCINDKVSLCQKCNEDLHPNPIQKLHQRVPIGDSVPNCSVHNTAMEFFCRSCVALCCAACKERSHHGHIVVTWRPYLSERKQDIHRTVETALSNLKGRGTELRTVLKDVNSKGTTARNELCAVLQPLFLAIQERSKQLTGQLNTMVTEKTDRIQRSYDAVNYLVADVDRQLANENTSPRELAELLNQIENQCNLPIPPSQVSFTSIPITQTLATITKLGCLSEISGITPTVSAVSSSTVTVQWPADDEHRQVEVQIADGVEEAMEDTQIQFSRSIFCVTPECMIPWNGSRMIAVRARVSALDILGPWGHALILSSSGGGKVLFTQPGIHSFTVPAEVSSVDTIVIGGGDGGFGDYHTDGESSIFGGYAQAAGGGSYNRTPATAELAGKGGPLSATAQKYIRQRKYGEGGVHMSSSPPQYAAPGAYTTMAGIRVTPGEIVKIVVGAGGEGGREQGAASGSGYPGLVAVSWGGMIL